MTDANKIKSKLTSDINKILDDAYLSGYSQLSHTRPLYFTIDLENEQLTHHLDYCDKYLKEKAKSQGFDINADKSVYTFTTTLELPLDYLNMYKQYTYLLDLEYDKQYLLARNNRKCNFAVNISEVIFCPNADLQKYLVNKGKNAGFEVESNNYVIYNFYGRSVSSLVNFSNFSRP